MLHGSLFCFDNLCLFVPVLAMQDWRSVSSDTQGLTATAILNNRWVSPDALSIWESQNDFKSWQQIIFSSPPHASKQRGIQFGLFSDIPASHLAWCSPHLRWCSACSPGCREHQCRTQILEFNDGLMWRSSCYQLTAVKCRMAGHISSYLFLRY